MIATNERGERKDLAPVLCDLCVPSRQNISTLSAAARLRMLSRRGEPLFRADWERVLMLHFEVDVKMLQRDVPYQLDLHDGRAFVSLVAFTMRGMRPRLGGRLAAWLFRPIATHEFLNVRTYVRNGGETGIHFLAEWLSNRLAVKLGPAVFGLPYRHGHIRYEHDCESGQLRGRVADAGTEMPFEYRADLVVGAPFVPCERGSLDEWLMERYTAFNCARGRKKFFRIWHPPWPQVRVDVELTSTSLLTQTWPWFAGAEFLFANFSPGVRDVWMGRPHRC
ncbi:MAG: DUF2071 domain-containing protein [Pedosphaera sp.]|nr:DUF2071 domain-containing protein [Pedosphaera sp.]